MSDIRKISLFVSVCVAAAVLSWPGAFGRPEPLENKLCTNTTCGVHPSSNDCLVTDNRCLANDPDQAFWTCVDKEDEDCTENSDVLNYCDGKCTPSGRTCQSITTGCEHSARPARQTRAKK